MHSDLNSKLFALQQSDNIFEIIINELYRKVLRVGDLAIDGGANRGLHSFPMAEYVGPSGKVIAFEPIPWLAENLRVERDQRGLIQLKVCQQALSNYDGTANFHWIRNADGYSGLQPRDYPEEPQLELINVNTVRLDRVLDTLSRPWRFMKLDLEGGEFNAMRGATKILKAHHPFIIFENARATSASAYGYSMEEYFGFFEGLNYTVRDLFGRPFNREDWYSEGYPWYFIATFSYEDNNLVVECLPQILERILSASFS